MLLRLAALSDLMRTVMLRIVLDNDIVERAYRRVYSEIRTMNDYLNTESLSNEMKEETDRLKRKEIRGYKRICCLEFGLKVPSDLKYLACSLPHVPRTLSVKAGSQTLNATNIF